ncbi:expressed unknown protein [Seminavis robusta]|uniref:Uncharacterized protein n=1 Tax=Seminavis robusta TaxID=568900 RepID=A0A9N8EBI8_9STRA|nr:expressed unknown protein [Seminavis robusta]|eukprot:Sro720_g192540.1 n/a (659) ;mRNA; r:11712-13688
MEQEGSTEEDTSVVGEEEEETIMEKDAGEMASESSTTEATGSEDDEKSQELSEEIISTPTTKEDCFRPPLASRRTVAELEAGGDDKKSKAAAIKSSGNSQPGAYSVDGYTERTAEHDATEVSNEEEEEKTLANTNIDCAEEETKEEESEPLPSQSPPSTVVENSSHGNNNSRDNNLDDKHAHRRDDEPAEEVPMIVAELVMPPVEAVQVIYDEHEEAHIDPEEPPQQQHSQRTSIEDDSADLDGDDNYLPCVMDKFLSKRLSKRFRSRCGLWMCLLSVCCCTVIPIAVNLTMGRNNNNNQEEEISVVDFPPSNAPTTVSSSYPYECFTGTRDIIAAQIESPEQLLFILCPHTRIKLGVLANPIAGDTNIVHGDTPLMILRENVEVRCGIDGSVDNHCILDGGFVQVLLQPHLPLDKEHVWKSRPTDNVTIRGLTFTGQLLSDYTFGGSSIVISNPGHTVQMVDCLWENMTAPSGLLYVGVNPFQLLALSEENNNNTLPRHAASLHVVQSRFRNITYDGALAEVSEQILSLEACRFEDLQLSAFASECDYWVDSGGATNWCQGLFFCLYDSVCSIQDICMSNFEFAGPAHLLVATNDSDVVLAGQVYKDNVRVPERLHSDETCSNGLARIDEYSGTYECMGEEMEADFIKSEVCSFPEL